MNPFRSPVKRRGDRFELRLGDEETALIRRLLGELRELLGSDDQRDTALTRRLFPVAHPDDPDSEAEYQRLMRDELVTSRLASIETLDETLDRGGLLDDATMTALCQSINSLRLVLAVMLGIDSDDDDGAPDDDGVAQGLAGTPEHHLYGYLSWLLEHSVRALSGS